MNELEMSTLTKIQKQIVLYSQQLHPQLHCMQCRTAEHLVTNSGATCRHQLCINRLCLRYDSHNFKLEDIELPSTVSSAVTKSYASSLKVYHNSLEAWNQEGCALWLSISTTNPIPQFH